MHKVVFLLLVILFVFNCYASNIKEGFTEFNIDEFEQVDTIKKDKHPSLLNIYGEPLHACKTGSSPGSWDSEGYCSEMGGGVHQICFNVTDETKNFSKDTGQSDWSIKRIGNNHCMCLGAFALHTAKGKGTGDDLECESIMEHSLDERYVGKWNTWNGNELPDQLVHGVNQLMEQCYKKGNAKQKQNIKDLYLNLTNDRKEFHMTDVHKQHTYDLSRL